MARVLYPELQLKPLIKAGSHFRRGFFGLEWSAPMGKILLASIIALMTVTASAKSPKLNEKSGRYVSLENLEAPVLIEVSTGSFEQMIQACRRFTSTNETESLCMTLQSDPVITEFCYRNTSTKKTERACLEAQSNPEVTVGCQRNTSTVKAEKVCLQYHVAPELAQVCKRQTATENAEIICLMSAGRSPVVP